MKKLVVFALVLVLSLGTLGACNLAANNNGSNSNGSTQQNNLSPADTVLLFAKLYTERDTNGLKNVLYRSDEYKFDIEGYTFVSLTINIQNPSAQMEPYEIEYYQERFDDLLNTAIVCAEVKYVYKSNETNQNEESVYYYDYYLISTASNPDWRIITWANQSWVTD